MRSSCTSRRLLALTKSSMSVFEPNHLRMRAGRIAQWCGACLEPSIQAVETANAKAQVERVAGADHAHPLHVDSHAIIGMHLLQPATTQLLRFAAAGVVDPLPAEVIARPVARAGPDHLRQRFGQGLEARPAFAQRLDGLAVLGDVDAGAEKPANSPSDRSSACHARAASATRHRHAAAGTPARTGRRASKAAW